MQNKNNRWSRSEKWMAKKLAATGRRWVRQAPSRFWQFRLGMIVEVNESGGADARTAARDRTAFYERGVIVVRVKEFDESEAAEALRAIGFLEPWNDRRRFLGLPPSCARAVVP